VRKEYYQPCSKCDEGILNFGGSLTIKSSSSSSYVVTFHSLPWCKTPVSDEYVKLSRFPGSNEDPESICERCSFDGLMLDKGRVKEEDGSLLLQIKKK
jgi:hypothetical protein